MEFYSDVPEDVILKHPLPIKRLTEVEVERYFREALSRNVNVLKMPCFLGGGFWVHYVPPLVDEVSSSPELLTSYTPYQPEISQGLLQILFEYQSMIADLYGMDVANASMYDWATALAEALLMAVRVTKRRRVVLPKYLPPWRRVVAETYLRPHGIEILYYGYSAEHGRAHITEIEKLIDGSAALYVENPNFFGVIEEDVEEMGEIVHRAGGLFIVGADPLSLGVYEAPGNYGADIAVGEGQHLGNPPSFGGPSLGIFTFRGDLKLVWQSPGRLIGLTRTLDGSRRGFVMALQAREQHIRRERATSNICTNEAWVAVRAAVYLALLGSSGLRSLGELIIERTYRLISLLSRLPYIEVPVFKAYYFREFPARLRRGRVSELNSKLIEHGVIGGLDLTGIFPELGESMLLATTEIHSDEDQEKLVHAMDQVLR